MSRYYANYPQYLGAQKCCDLRTQGPEGPQGPPGPAGIGQRGMTGAAGSTGPTGNVGPTGYSGTSSQWFLGEYIINKPTGTTGFTGIGYTGNVGIFGDLNVNELFISIKDRLKNHEKLSKEELDKIIELLNFIESSEIIMYTKENLKRIL